MLLTLVPGKGAWYRVRVGKFGARKEADQTAQRLRSRESMDVLVMKESS
jgi:cell division protein FtsN